jgi:alkylation response protein AidB-like acyl-CoA dehydrogenase
MIERAATLYASGARAGEASNMAKYAGAEAGIRCLDQAIETHGGSAFMGETGISDLMALTRAFRNIPVSREMILNYVAEHTLGLPKSY